MPPTAPYVLIPFQDRRKRGPVLCQSWRHARQMIGRCDETRVGSNRVNGAVLMSFSFVPVAVLVPDRTHRFIPVTRYESLTSAGVAAVLAAGRNPPSYKGPTPIDDVRTQRVTSALYLTYEDEWLRGVVMVRANGTPGGALEFEDHDDGGVEAVLRQHFPASPGAFREEVSASTAGAMMASMLDDAYPLLNGPVAPELYGMDVGKA